MKRLLALVLLLLVAAPAALAQEKGVDQQNERVRDSSNNRQPAVNGGKVDTGTGRGMDFGRGRTPEPVRLPNPYRLAARRDRIAEAVRELMREQNLVLDETTSRPDEGILISQPFTFARGAVGAASELSRFGELPAVTARGWTRGRYTLTVELQPIDGTSTNVSVNARVEGRTEGVSGTEWITLVSTGAAEQDFLAALIEKITGAPPPGRERP